MSSEGQEKDTATIDVRELPLDAPDIITASPVQRRLSDESVDNLARSIASIGLVHPILVRPVGGKGAGLFEMIAGHRRLAACRKLGHATIRAEVREVDDATAHAMTAAENLQRSDLTPLEQAAAIKVLQDAGQGVAQIAEQLGWAPGTVARRAALINLSASWRLAIERRMHACDQFPAAHLGVIARMPEESQNRLLQEHVEEDQGWDGSGNAEHRVPSMRELRRWCDAEMGDLSAAKWDKEDASLGAEACSACSQRSDLQPDLFDDIAVEGKRKAAPVFCLNRECFQRKQRAFLLRQLAEQRKKHGQNLHVILDAYGDVKREDLGLPEDVPVIARSYDWQETRKTDPQAKPVFVGAGTAAGTVKYMRPLTRSAGTEAKTGAKSVADKRAQLERRRALALLTLVVQRLNAAKASPPEAIVGDTIKALAAPVVFGSTIQGEYGDKQLWAKLAKQQDVSPSQTDKLIGAVLGGTLENWARLVHYDHQAAQASRGLPAMENMKGICAYMGWDLVMLKAEIEKKIPEPKSWTAKAPGKSRGKK